MFRSFVTRNGNIADVAQLVEQLICNQSVGGSSPFIGSTNGRQKNKTGRYQSGQMGQTVNLLVYTFGGSNPSSPTKKTILVAEVAQLIEHQPSKLRVASLSLVFRSKDE